MILLLVLCLVSFAFPAFAGEQKVFDYADLLTTEEEAELQQMAANMNANGRIDIGDATKIASKLNNDWANYESLLNPSVVVY